jgi:hypothetical protein
MELAILIIVCIVCMGVALFAKAVTWFMDMDFGPDLEDITDDDLPPKYVGRNDNGEI